MKKFFKKTEGFTLVELVVVIAILGILAGVGTVGYSGYIKKANEAADNQLLAALNQAYAVACIENGEDAKQTNASDIKAGKGKVVTEADIAVTNPAEKNTEIQKAFAKYFVSGGEFKYFDKLYFAKGAFVGKNAEVLAQAANAGWGESNFGKGEDGGKTVAENFLGTLDAIDGFLDAGLTLDRLLEKTPENLVNALGFTDMFGGFDNMGVEHFASDAAGRTAQEVLDGATSIITLLTPAYTGEASAVTNGEILGYYKQTLSGDDLARFNGMTEAKQILEAKAELKMDFGDLHLSAEQVAAVMKGAGDTKNNADISGLGGMYALAAGFYHSSCYDPATMGPKPSNYGEFGAVLSAASNQAAFNEYLSSQAVKDMEAYVSFMSYLSTGDFSGGSYSAEGYEYMKEALGIKEN